MDNLSNRERLSPAGEGFDGGIEGREGRGEDGEEDTSPEQGIDGIVEQEIHSRWTGRVVSRETESSEWLPAACGG